MKDSETGGICDTARKERAMIMIGVIACSLALDTLGVLWAGYVLTVLWSWFIVPFFGLPTLAVLQAVGLVIVVSYLTGGTGYPTEEPPEEFSDLLKKIIKDGPKMIVRKIMHPALFLGSGWVVRLSM